MSDVELKEYLERLISEMEKQDAARWESHRREHELLKEAVDAAYAALSTKLEMMNEMRTQILSERGDFLKKSEYGIEQGQLEKRVNKLENDKSNLDGRFWMLGSVITGLSILLPLLFHYVVK